MATFMIDIIALQGLYIEVCVSCYRVCMSVCVAGVGIVVLQKLNVYFLIKEWKNYHFNTSTKVKGLVIGTIVFF